MAATKRIILRNACARPLTFQYDAKLNETTKQYTCERIKITPGKAQEVSGAAYKTLQKIKLFAGCVESGDIKVEELAVKKPATKKPEGSEPVNPLD